MYIGNLLICNLCDWITQIRYFAVMTTLGPDRSIKEASEYFLFKIQRLQRDNGSKAQSDVEKFVKELFETTLNHTPLHSSNIEWTNRKIK